MVRSTKIVVGLNDGEISVRRAKNSFLMTVCMIPSLGSERWSISSNHINELLELVNVIRPDLVVSVQRCIDTIRELETTFYLGFDEIGGGG